VIAGKQERDMHALVAKVVELQLKKLELKMKNIEEVESTVDRDRQQIERARQALYAEQLQFTQAKLGASKPTVTTPQTNASHAASPFGVSTTPFSVDPQQL